MRNSRCAVFRSATPAVEREVVLLARKWSTFVVLKLNLGFAVIKANNSALVAKDEVAAFNRPPAKAVVGYLLVKRWVNAFANRAILCGGVSSGSTDGMLVPPGSTPVIRTIQSFSSRSARSCALPRVF